MRAQQKPDPKKYCMMYIARHGETDWNVKHIIQGHKDSRLNKKGKFQAKNLAKQLQNITFDALFSSDLLRAKQTAQIVALEHKLALTTTKFLRERAFGHFEGKTREKYSEEMKDLLEKFEKLSEEEKHRFKFAPDIESDQELIHRLIPYIREISVAHIGKKVLMIAHGGIIRMICAHMGLIKRSQLKFGSIENTAYIKLLCDGTDFFLEETSGINLV